MNDQEEKLVRKSRWSPSRVVLLYWVAVVFVGTATAAGLGATILNSKFSFNAADAVHPTFDEPWHPENCTGCHDDIVDSWNQTWHSQYVGSKLVVNGTTGEVTRYPNRYMPPMLVPETWDNISEFAATGYCCMATNWENTTQPGDTVPSGTLWDLGVTCAACHDTPGEVNPAAEVCQGCHSGAGGAQYTGWNTSAHSQSLDNLLASDHARDSCLHCMAGQATYMDVTGMAVNDTSLTNIVCVTCHDPHDSSINTDAPSDRMSPWTNPITDVEYGPGGHQLRTATTNELCGKCHGDSYELLSDTVYTSEHQGLDCTDCHGYRWLPEYTTIATGGPSAGQEVTVPAGMASLNHSWTFEPFPEACSMCHDNNNVTRWNTMQEMDYVDLMETYETQLENVTAKAGEAENKSGVDEAKIDNVYELIDEAKDLADAASLGFHNPELAEQKAKLALAKLDEAYAAADDAIETRRTPGFEWIGVILAFSILGVFAVLFRKKRR